MITFEEYYQRMKGRLVFEEDEPTGGKPKPNDTKPVQPNIGDFTSKVGGDNSPYKTYAEAYEAYQQAFGNWLDNEPDNVEEPTDEDDLPEKFKTKADLDKAREEALTAVKTPGSFKDDDLDPKWGENVAFDDYVKTLDPKQKTAFMKKVAEKANAKFREDNGLDGKEYDDRADLLISNDLKTDKSPKKKNKTVQLKDSNKATKLKAENEKLKQALAKLDKKGSDEDAAKALQDTMKETYAELHEEELKAKLLEKINKKNKEEGKESIESLDDKWKDDPEYKSLLDEEFDKSPSGKLAQHNINTGKLNDVEAKIREKHKKEFDGILNDKTLTAEEKNKAIKSIEDKIAQETKAEQITIMDNMEGTADPSALHAMAKASLDKRNANKAQLDKLEREMQDEKADAEDQEKLAKLKAEKALSDAEAAKKKSESALISTIAQTEGLPYELVQKAYNDPDGMSDDEKKEAQSLLDKLKTDDGKFTSIKAQIEKNEKAIDDYYLAKKEADEKKAEKKGKEEAYQEYSEMAEKDKQKVMKDKTINFLKAQDDIKNGKKPFDGLTDAEKKKLLDAHKAAGGDPDKMAEFQKELEKKKTELETRAQGEALAGQSEKATENQQKRDEKILGEKNKAMNSLLKGDFGGALKSLGSFFLLKLQDKELTEQENSALEAAAEKLGGNKKDLITARLRELGVDNDIIERYQNDEELSDKDLKAIAEKGGDQKPEDGMPSKEDIENAVSQVNDSMQEAENSVPEEDDTTNDDDEEDSAEDADGEDVENDDEEADGDGEDVETDEDNGEGGKKKLKNPKKEWHRKKKKNGSGTTKSYYNGEKNSDGSPISISAEEFKEKVKAYQEAKKRQQSGGGKPQQSNESFSGIVSFEDFMKKKLFEKRIRY